MQLVTIECKDCDWAFDNVPYNQLAQEIVDKHIEMYDHKVRLYVS